MLAPGMKNNGIALHFPNKFKTTITELVSMSVANQKMTNLILYIGNSSKSPMVLDISELAKLTKQAIDCKNTRPHVKDMKKHICSISSVSLTLHGCRL